MTVSPPSPRAASERARLLEAVYDATVEFIGVLSPDGTVLDANRASLEFVDASMDSVAGRPYWECPWLSHDSEMAARVRDAIGEASTGRQVRFDATMGSADGRTLRVDFSVRPIFDIDGRVEYLIPEGRDITARLDAEEALASRKARLRLIVDNTHDLIFLVRVEGPDTFRCESVNAAYLRVTGLAEEDVVGKLLEEILPQPAADFARARYHEVIAKGEAITYVEDAVLPQGRVVVETRLAPVREENGAITHLLGIAQDVTARQDAEAALRESELRFRAALDASLDAFVIMRAVHDTSGAVVDFEFVDVNVRAGQLSGRPHWELPGLRLTEVFPESMDSGLVDQSRAVLASGKPFEIEQFSPLPGAPIRWVKRQIVRLGDGVAITSRDITERRLEQEALRHSEARFRAVIDGMREGVVLHDEMGAIRLWNPAAERILGVTGDQLLGKTGRQSQWIARREDGTPWPTETRPALLALQSGENQPSAVMQLQRPDGTTMWLTVTAAPLIRPGETKPYAAVATFSDITEHRALEDRVRQAYKLEAVGQLAGGIAHDFNNVLTAIRGAGEFLADIIPAGAAGYEDISIIQRATDRAAWLTRQLLSFGQRQVLQSRLTDLNAIVRAEEAEINAALPTNITVRYDLRDDVRLVRVDERQLAEALRTLVANGADAMPTGGTLSIATRSGVLDPNEAAARGLQPGAYSVLAVTDTGIGIDESVRAHLFEPFFSTKPFGERTGMGLAAVYGLVAQSQGFVDCDTARFVGTTFRLHFPEANDFMPTTVPRVDTTDGTSDTALPLYDAEKRTVLVVDDEPVLREVTCRMLARHGCATIGAASGAEAIALLEMHLGTVDLLLTDLTMPGMHGHELVRRVRTLRADLPIVLMSGFTMDDEARRSVGADALPFLSKPFSRDELARALREAWAGNTRGPAGG